MSFRLFARRRAFETAIGAAAFALLAALPPAALAQVLEIDPTGGVKVFDGPAVVSATGVTPIPQPAEPTPPAPAPMAEDAPGLTPATLSLIGDAAHLQSLSPALVEAVAWAESRFVHGRVSRAGAIGEMQLMPLTARSLRVDASDSRQNYQGGAEYLRMLMNRYNGDVVRTLAAYNAGPEAVDRYRGVPPYKDTQAYVATVLARLSRSDAKGAGP